MTITKSPKRITADGFIAKAGKGVGGAVKKPMLLRFTPEMFNRIDQAAKRLGITRSAFIYQSTARELERMEA
jgi:hypothetical protein